MNFYSYEECLFCQEIAHILEKKLECITKYDRFGGNNLNIDVLENLWMSLLSALDYNEPIHESWLHMQDANKIKASSCVLIVKWPFSQAKTLDIMTPLLCSRNGTL